MFIDYGLLSTAYYEATKPVGYSIGGDLEYYRSRLANVRGKVLEAGVGTGRLFIPLAQAGFQMEGIELSEEMLAICRAHCEAHQVEGKLMQGDLLALNQHDVYEAIIMPTGSVGLLGSDLEPLFRQFYEALQEGGRAIVDFAFPTDWSNVPSTSVVPLTEMSGLTLESKPLQIDWIEQSTTTLLKYEKWENGRCIETELQSFTLYWHKIATIKKMLREIGFRDVHVSSDYQYGKEPTVHSEIIIMEAMK